jgi:hypothetical protein
MLTRTYGYAGRLIARADAGLPFRDVLARDLWDYRQIEPQLAREVIPAVLKYYPSNSHGEVRSTDVIRDEIKQLVALGSLPNEETATDEQIQEIQRLLESIERPVNDEEARALATLFQHDDSLYGLAWTLLHLIETAPTIPILAQAPQASANEWLKRIWNRAQRAKKQQAHQGGT